MNTGCLILAGGKSRRMGYRKSSLRLNGTTFLDKLIFELRDFPEILVSVDDAAPLLFGKTAGYSAEDVVWCST